MAAMTRLLNQRNVAGWFRFVALLEAASWVGLLIGMYFKYLGTPPTEVGVKIFGPVHGAIFVAFVAVAILAGIAFGWAVGTWLWAFVASIVPLGSVIFVMWAERTARMGDSPAVAALAQPRGPAPETT